MVQAEVEQDLRTCEDCGREGLKGQKGINAHKKLRCPANPEAHHTEAKRIANIKARAEMGGGTVVQSRRGMSRRGFATRVPTPLEQIRSRPGGLTGGPAAYYINPNGATIREALIIYPNGAEVLNRNGRDVANSAYYRNRQQQKGYTYIGPTLTREGARLLVETIQRNRDDYVLDLQEQIADCKHEIKESDSPAVRENQRKRKMQLDRLLEQASQPLDADKLVQELQEIVQAHRLASVNPGLREIIAEIAGDVANAKVLALAERVRGGKAVSGEFAGGNQTVTVSNVEGDF